MGKKETRAEGAKLLSSASNRLWLTAWQRANPRPGEHGFFALDEADLEACKIMDALCKQLCEEGI